MTGAHRKKQNHSDAWALSLLFLSFALLWVPLGQTAFLIEHWMKVGTFMAPFLTMTAVAFRAPGAGPMRSDIKVLSVLMLVAYIAHQFEEHWIDLTGQTYAFYGYVNALVVQTLDAPAGTEILTPEAIFVINTALVWLVGALAIVRAPAHAFPSLAMAAIILINAIAHIAAAVRGWAYNPGLLTSVLIFVPISLWFYGVVLRRGAATRADVVIALAWAVMAHVIMVFGMIAANWLKLFSETVYFAMLVLWALVPIGVYSRKGSTVVGRP